MWYEKKCAILIGRFGCVTYIRTYSYVRMEKIDTLHFSSSYTILDLRGHTPHYILLLFLFSTLGWWFSLYDSLKIPFLHGCKVETVCSQNNGVATDFRTIEDDTILAPAPAKKQQLHPNISSMVCSIIKISA